MKGVPRSALLFCWGWKPQRLLLGAGLLLIVGASLAFRIFHLSGHAATTWWPLSEVLLVMGTASALGVSGVSFRATSAPRALRFAPFARLQLALGMLLAEVLLATGVTVSLALVHPVATTLSPDWGNLTHTFFAALASMSLVVFLAFFASSDAPMCRWITAAVTLIGMTIPILLWGSGIELPRVSTTGFASVTIAAWVPFAAWYLGARRIGPPNLLENWGMGRVPNTKDIETRQAALNIYLLGQPSVFRACRSDLVSMVVYNALLVGLMLGAGRIGAILDLRYVLTVTFMIVGGAGLRLATPIAQRARALWIRSGCSRQELFDTAERLSLRCIACMAIATLALSAAEWTVLPHGTADWKLLSCVVLAMLLCDVYLGLVSARQGSPNIFALIASSSIGLVVIFPHELWLSWGVSSPLALILTGEVLIVLVLRFFAKRRWHRIDWLVCRPPQVSTQMVRSAT